MEANEWNWRLHRRTLFLNFRAKSADGCKHYFIWQNEHKNILGNTIHTHYHYQVRKWSCATIRTCELHVMPVAQTSLDESKIWTTIAYPNVIVIETCMSEINAWSYAECVSVKPVAKWKIVVCHRFLQPSSNICYDKFLSMAQKKNVDCVFLAHLHKLKKKKKRRKKKTQFHFWPPVFFAVVVASAFVPVIVSGGCMVLFFPHFLCFSFTLSVLFNCLCMRLNVLPVVFNPLISMLISFLYFHKRRIQLKDPVVWLPQFAKLITFDFSRMLDGTHDFSLLIFVRFFFFSFCLSQQVREK